MIIATITVLVNLIAGQFIGVLDAIFFYLGGNGVRQRSRAAAICVFAVYALETFALRSAGAFQIVRYAFTAILFSNIRAMWIASARVKRGEVEEPPALLNETFADKIANTWPPILWPKTRIVFFILTAVELVGVLALLAGMK